MHKNLERGSKFDIKLVFDMSQMIFKQDGVGTYTALET